MSQMQIQMSLKQLGLKTLPWLFKSLISTFLSCGKELFQNEN